jgi:hypothetical protein
LATIAAHLSTFQTTLSEPILAMMITADSHTPLPMPLPRIRPRRSPPTAIAFSPRTRAARRFWRRDLSFLARWAWTLSQNETTRMHLDGIFTQMLTDWQALLAPMPERLRHGYRDTPGVEQLEHVAKNALETRFAELVTIYDELTWCYVQAAADGRLTADESTQAQHWLAARLRGITRLFGRNQPDAEHAPLVRILNGDPKVGAGETTAGTEVSAEGRDLLQDGVPAGVTLNGSIA